MASYCSTPTPSKSVLLSPLIAVAFTLLNLSTVSPLAATTAESPQAEAAMTARIRALVPDLEATIANGMKAFDVPGLAIGIVTGDRLVYSRGFGARSRPAGSPVDARTVFQIGSTTKAFLATTMAIAVDRGSLRWNDRVVDLDPTFQLKDPWVTRAFRVFDLIAQRSGLPPYANDMVGLLGADAGAMIRSLRHVEPITSFRSRFAYTNITHLLAARIVAQRLGAEDWNAVARREILDPLGMTHTSFTAESIAAAANHSEGYRWTPDGTIEVPFDPIFPYGFGAAGNINSNIEDMARWLRLQLGNGTFEGRSIVSADHLAATRTPKVAITEKISYALGWIVQQTPNGTVVWHNGGTSAFGAYVGMLPDRDVGAIILTNEQNVGFPDAVGAWLMDRLLDNPPVDHVADTLAKATARFEAEGALFAGPENPRPVPPLAPLAGSYINPSFGSASVRVVGGALVMELEATGAQLQIEPWDGDVFVARLIGSGRFRATVENLGPSPAGFVQFQMDRDGKLGVLRLSFDDGQAYTFRRAGLENTRGAHITVPADASHGREFAHLTDILERDGTRSPTVKLAARSNGSVQDSDPPGQSVPTANARSRFIETPSPLVPGTLSVQ